MDRDPLNECDGRDETNDQDDLSAEDTQPFLRLLLHLRTSAHCHCLMVGRREMRCEVEIKILISILF